MKPIMKPIKRQTRVTPENAEEIALKALVFLAEDNRRLTRFLADTGLEPGELREHAGRRDTLAAVLGHLCEDESMLLVFAAGASVDPTEVTAAHAALAGPATWDSV